MWSISALLRCIALGVAGAVMVPAGPSAVAAREPVKAPAMQSSQRTRVTYDIYILGSGDSLQIERLDIPDLTGTFSIEPDGTIYLPRLRALYVERLTVEELRYFLTEQFKTYVKNPQVFLTPVGYRAVRVYEGGEISQPGYYMLSGSQIIQDQLKIQESASPNSFRAQRSSLKDFQATRLRLQRSATDDVSVLQGIGATPNRWPTLLNALRAAQGVTP
jgi:polysaccharide export outer membrane protein